MKSGSLFDKSQVWGVARVVDVRTISGLFVKTCPAYPARVKPHDQQAFLVFHPFPISTIHASQKSGPFPAG